ncbi:MAG: Peptidase superfamily [Planctomycetota bacterium]|jgi:hypothetical protein
MRLLHIGPLTFLLLLCWLSPDLFAQKKPEICPYCRNEPERMQKAGVVSHGPIAIGPAGSEGIIKSLPTSQWLFLETAHLRWASSLGPMTVDLNDKKRVMAELDRLRLVLPDVPKEPKKLDPWLRLHLMGMKGEEFYARFQALLMVTDADFPETRQMDKPFMGNGRFLGEKEKFEVVVHHSRATHLLFTRDFSGAQVTNALRWHSRERHNLLCSIPAEDPDLRQDRWLWPHIVHNLSHAFLCAYKHFSYDPPVWLDEGLAIAMEKEIEPRSTTHEGEEGSMRDSKDNRDYAEAARKLLTKDKLRGIAELTEVKEFGELTADDQISVWSRVRFLIEEHPDAFAKFLGGIKGQLDENQIPTGRDLPGLQRSLLQEFLGFSPLAFDDAWRAWLAKQP